MQQAGELFTTSEQAELERIAEWAGRTTDGSLSDLPVEPDSKVWTQVCSEAHICTTKTCGQTSNCFFQQARKRLLAADVIVANHTLLFMLLGTPEEQMERESGYLFPNDFIIFDEAHTVEQVASRQIGITISQYGLKSTIQRLYNARTKKGLFTVTRDAAGVTLAASLADEVDTFFSLLGERADFRKGREVRIRRADFVPDTLSARLAGLQVRIMEVVKKTEDEFLKAEMQELGRRIRDARTGIVTFLEQSAEGHV
jgi:ATP-dependent DNA helicase DinG